MCWEFGAPLGCDRWTNKLSHTLLWSVNLWCVYQEYQSIFNNYILSTWTKHLNHIVISFCLQEKVIVILYFMDDHTFWNRVWKAMRNSHLCWIFTRKYSTNALFIKSILLSFSSYSTQIKDQITPNSRGELNPQNVQAAHMIPNG